MKQEGVMRPYGRLKQTPAIQHLMGCVLGNVRRYVHELRVHFNLKELPSDEMKEKILSAMSAQDYLLFLLYGPPEIPAHIANDPAYQELNRGAILPELEDDRLLGFLGFVAMSFDAERSVRLENGRFVFTGFPDGSSSRKAIEELLGGLDKKYDFKDQRKVESNPA